MSSLNTSSVWFTSPWNLHPCPDTTSNLAALFSFIWNLNPSPDLGHLVYASVAPDLLWTARNKLVHDNIPLDFNLLMRIVAYTAKLFSSTMSKPAQSSEQPNWNSPLED
ncbi:hypothetical protein TorRG33x02_183920 [Trema orientale]|uniref:Uncharacterized protein n=1 Tax=Trema orientale TaxID=63057 RepID=A0A2P5EJU6_TREOI|nr:hypothetical protein TorRG33x02_183920 [Trema orientale]